MQQTAAPARTGACWGCSKGATNACECFDRSHWSGIGCMPATPTTKKGGPNRGPPSAANGAPAGTEPATAQKRCVLGVPQRGHKRL